VTGHRPDKSEEHKLLSNIFHLISQPMTALQCSLEFALNTLDDPQQCRTWIEAALENSERLRCRLSLAREIADAANSDTPAQTAELRSVLEEAVSEAEPFFQQGAIPQLHGDEIEVWGERARLLRAFFYILQQLRASDRTACSTPEIWVEHRAELVEVRFQRFVLRENLNKDQVASQLEIAKEILQSAGGGLLFYCFAGNDALVRVFLRAPQSQLDLYDDADRASKTSNIGRMPIFPQVS
jgi:hypothetical protein